MPFLRYAVLRKEEERRRWRNRRFSRFLVMTSTVYSSYFSGIFGYRNASNQLYSLRLGVSKGFVCYG